MLYETWRLSMAWKRAAIPLALLLIGIALGFALGTSHATVAQKRDADGRILGNYENSSRAREIKPGIALSAVISELGDPIGQTDGWLEFVSSPNGRAIRVRIGPSGLVAEIDPGVN
jgi:hypothetical protein